ncbi:MAG TPA: NADH-quinone oxidoreductase subunit M [Bacilli bacterium]
MLDNIPILSLITFSPLLGILVLLFMPRGNGRWLKIVGIATTLLPLVLSILLFTQFDRHSGEVQFVENVTWMHIPLNQEGKFIYGLSDYFIQIQYKMAVDGMSLVLLVLTALVSVMAALAAAHIKKRWKTFYILYLLMEIGLLGVFMARDLILFFIFFELVLVPTFFLIGIWGYKERERAANKFLLYNGIGSAVMLIAFLILINTAGFVAVPGEQGTTAYYTSDYDQIVQNLNNSQALVNYGAELQPGFPNPMHLGDTMKWALFLMILIAFGIKLPIFPFHTWMLKVHAEAPPSIVMVHSGIMLKMGAYGLIRFGMELFPGQTKEWAFMIAVLGVINILYGAVLAFRQAEFKLVLAYSSISHMGIILLGIAALNVLGVKAAIFQMLSHGLISALLFLLVGSIVERTGSTELNELGGLAKSIPFIGGILMLAGLASLGLPGLSGFVAELMAFTSLFDSHPAVTVIGMIGIILAAVYMLRAVLKITFGPIPERFELLKEARLIEAVPMVTLAAAIVLVGVYPSLFDQQIQETVNAMLQNFDMRIGG